METGAHLPHGSDFYLFNVVEVLILHNENAHFVIINVQFLSTGRVFVHLNAALVGFNFPLTLPLSLLYLSSCLPFTICILSLRFWRF